jgi:hypothetical protein
VIYNVKKKYKKYKNIRKIKRLKEKQCMKKKAKTAEQG